MQELKGLMVCILDQLEEVIQWKQWGWLSAGPFWPPCAASSRYVYSSVYYNPTQKSLRRANFKLLGYLFNALVRIGTYWPDVYTFSSLSSAHGLSTKKCPTGHIGASHRNGKSPSAHNWWRQGQGDDWRGYLGGRRLARFTPNCSGAVVFQSNFDGATAEKCDSIHVLFIFILVWAESRRPDARRRSFACRIHLNIGQLHFLIG